MGAVCSKTDPNSKVPPGVTRQSGEWAHDPRHATCGERCVNDALKAILRKPSAVNDLRRTLRGAVVPALQRSVAMLLWRSAALALRCSDALLLQRFVALTLWCSSSPVLHRSSTLALRCSRALLSKRSTARALRQLIALALQCYGTPALRCSGPLLHALRLKRSIAPALQ